MTDKEFVLSVYPNAKFLSYISTNCRSEPRQIMSIEILPDAKDQQLKYIGYNVGHTEEATWRYARYDMEVEMLRMLALDWKTPENM